MLLSTRFREPVAFFRVFGKKRKHCAPLGGLAARTALSSATDGLPLDRTA
jgi:hypothetical protein